MRVPSHAMDSLYYDSNLSAPLHFMNDFPVNNTRIILDLYLKMNRNTAILLIILIIFLLLSPILTPIISFAVTVGVIIVLVALIYTSLSDEGSEPELYIGENPAEFAAMFQETPLPSSDELSEEGGGYDIAEGIQSPKVSRKNDPWLFPTISWN